MLPHRSHQPGRSLGGPVCVNIQLSTSAIAQPWNADTRTITLPAGQDTRKTTLLVRAVLIELDVVQPHYGALCYCGELLDIAAVVRRGPARIGEVVFRGA